jgi:oligosaccharide repeat unit polymerase
MLAELVAVVLPGLALVLIAMAARIAHGHWLAPSAFLALCWCAYYLLGGVGVFIQGQPVAWGAAILVGMIAVYALGAALALPFLPKQFERDSALVAEPNTLWLARACLIFSALSFYAVPGVLAYAGFGLADMLSLARLQNIASSMSELRYGELADEPVLVRAALGFMYVAALLGGVLFAVSAKRSHRVIALSALGISLLYVLVTTSKTPMMLTLMMFTGAWAAESVRRAGMGFVLFTPVRLILGSSLVALATFYLYFLVQLRANDFSNEAVVGEGFRSYFFSHLATFSAWIKAESLQPSELSWGQYSFSGLLGRLGLAERQAGIYSSVVMPTTGDLSNLFTAFRGLLQDFGAAGSVLLLFVLGAASQWLYSRVLIGSELATTGLAVVYFTAMLSFLYSPFIFNNVIIACLIFALLRFAISRMKAEQAE